MEPAARVRPPSLHLLHANGAAPGSPRFQSGPMPAEPRYSGGPVPSTCSPPRGPACALLQPRQPQDGQLPTCAWPVQTVVLAGVKACLTVAGRLVPPPPPSPPPPPP